MYTRIYQIFVEVSLFIRNSVIKMRIHEHMTFRIITLTNPIRLIQRRNFYNFINARIELYRINIIFSYYPKYFRTLIFIFQITSNRLARNNVAERLNAIHNKNRILFPFAFIFDKYIIYQKRRIFKCVSNFL